MSTVTITKCPPGPIDPELTVEHHQKLRRSNAFALAGRMDYAESAGFTIAKRGGQATVVPSFAADDAALKHVLRHHEMRLGRMINHEAADIESSQLESFATRAILHCCPADARNGRAIRGRRSSYLSICAGIAWMSWRNSLPMRAVDIADELGITANNVRQIRHRLVKAAEQLGYATISQEYSNSKRIGGFASGRERAVRRVKSWQAR